MREFIVEIRGAKAPQSKGAIRESPLQKQFCKFCLEIYSADLSLAAALGEMVVSV